MSDLAIRETILGVLKGKDTSGRNVIHSSDFRTAISELGFPMGSAIVENILVHCKLDNHGNIDFSNLERELIRERRVANANRKTEPKVPPTSTGVVSKPWRADVVHQAKVEAEKQLRTVTEHNPQINQLYHALSHHEISADDVVNALYALDIVPTKAFLKVVQNMAYNDVSYAEFVKSLTKFDPNTSDLDRQQVSAGGYTPRTTDVADVALSTQRKTLRVNPTIKSAFFQSNNNNTAPPPTMKPVRKMVGSAAAASSDQLIFKTQKTKQIIFSDDDPVALMSHNQQDMVVGTVGETVDAVHFNSEMKLQREQVLAALRKLDSGQISMDDFLDLCFSMGIDLPETLIVAIRRAVSSGRMDIRRFVKELDASIFKSAAIDDRVRPDDVESLQSKFRQGVRRFGVDSISNLALIFRKMDSDGDGTLTFTEFRQGCTKLQLIARGNGSGNDAQLTEDELRRLFHAFDNNGDGVLAYSELLAAIVGVVSPERKAMIKKAFLKLDRHGEGKVLIDTIADVFQAERHPLVTAGEKTAREVRSELIHWLSEAAPAAMAAAPHRQSDNIDDDWSQQQREQRDVSAGYVPYPAFEQYFASLSAAIDDDGVFQTMMTNCFALTDKAPAPPVFKLRQGGGRRANETPLAIQTHGDCITWQQEASLIEENETRQSQQGRKIIGGYLRNNSNQMNLIHWSPPKKGNGGVAEETIRDELSMLGISNVSKGQKNLASGNWMAWQPSSASKKTAAAATTATSSSSSYSSGGRGGGGGGGRDVPVTIFQAANNEATRGSASTSSGLFQDEFVSAGGRQAQHESAAARLTSSKVRDYHTITKPYGVDEDDRPTASNAKGQVKSLADLMKAKTAGGANGAGGGPRSLADFVH